MTVVDRLAQPVWAVAVLVLACVVTYGHTLDVPMYLDDISSISDNPAIQDASDWSAIFGFSPMRFVGYLSFALNYAAHGVDVTGYHLANTLIHLGVAFALYVLLTLLARSPALSGTELRQRMPVVALCVSLLFLVHPLHTQAVTYIVQRLASLVALFYVLSLLAYVWGRLQSPGRGWHGYVACAVFALLALLTKQNAVTLPAALLLVEYTFFAADSRARRRVALSGLALLGVSLALLLVLNLSGLVTLEALDSGSRETLRISRADYLAAQMLVLWRYLVLFAWPDPLVLDYGLQPVWSWGSWPVLAAAALHLLVIATAAVNLRRLPLVAFGVLFYYLAHAVESGLIPIKDLMFEHRAYLPDVGLMIVFAGLLARLKPAHALAMTLVLTVVLSIVTWNRNNLWRDQVAFFNHAIEHAPEQPRNWVYLSKVYHKAGENARALEFLERELRANEQRHGRLRTDVATRLYWAKLLRLNGQEARARELENQLASSSMTRVQQLRLLLQQGNAALRDSDFAAAEAAYQRILEIDPKQSSAAINLGVIAMQQGRYPEAIEIFERFPDHPVARENLPKVRAAMEGRLRLEGLEERVIEKAQ